MTAKAKTATRAKRGSLNSQLIEEAALVILDRDGVQGLSMRSVAEQLSTKTMSLYSHISGRDALLAAVKNRLYGEFNLAVDESPPPKDWVDGLSRVFRTAYELEVRHPSFIQLLLDPVPGGPEGTRRYQSDLMTLRQAGFDEEGATLAMRILVGYLSGYTLTQPLMDPASDQVDHQGIDRFCTGIQWILDGLEHQLRSFSRVKKTASRSTRSKAAD